MFNLAALGAGLGEFAQQYRQQQEQAIKQQQLQMQMQQFAQRQQEQQRQASAQAGLNAWMRSGAADQFQGLSPMPMAGGGGMRAGGALTGGGKGTLSFPELRSYAEQAGFQGSKADEMAAISLAESGGNPFAHNPKYPDDSYGLTQINALAHGPKAREALGNPLRAMQLAYEVSGGGQNFKPWTAYTSGAYRRYLGQGGGADVAAGTGDFAVPSYGEAPAATPDTVVASQQQRPSAIPASYRAGPKTQIQNGRKVSEDEYNYGFVPPDLKIDPRANRPAQDTAPGGMPLVPPPPGAAPGRMPLVSPPGQQQAQADPMAAVQQQVQQGIQKTAQTIPPPLFGRVGLQALMKQIDQVNPGADEATKFMMLEGAQAILAPDAKMQYEYWKSQNDQTLRKEMTLFEHNLRMQEQGPKDEALLRRQKDLYKYEHDLKVGDEKPDMLTDPVTGQQYLYDRRAKKATTLEGEEYHPGGAQKVGGPGGSPLSADRAKDLSGEVSRLDREWATANPLASDDEKRQAHFQNRAKAEKVLAEAKASTTRQSPRTLIFRKAMEEHPDLTAEELQTYYNNQVTNEAIARSVGNGDIGKQIRAVNTVADHILRVQDYAEALGNGDIPRANQLANAVSKELGRGEVTTFEAGRDIMADEVVRLLTSTGGTEKDREGMQSRIAAMMSPEQFAGVFRAFRDFSGARLEALRQQVTHGDPKKEAQFEKELLTESGRRVFSGMKPPQSTGVSPSRPAGGGAAAAPAGGGLGQDKNLPALPRTPDEVDRLPPGTYYIDPRDPEHLRQK